ncbi:MAG: Cytochrome c-type biosis protein DsbD, protein-disulfide reductase [Xanthobacteraceae bacterium]|nr:Cytochrome c-type biosis protein DsbD, protein-disulfide reductase [Xanthobacteraceae bacterium]
MKPVPGHPNRFALLAAAGLALLTVSGAIAAENALAQDASAWDQDLHAGARLIAGSKTPDGVRRAGLEIRLDPGWHTYWRYPGDAGVPPQFDFSTSDNVKDVQVRWPAPRRLLAGGSTSIGYEHELVLPLRVTPRDPAKPAVLRLKLDYAICEKLCVPASGKAELSLPGIPSPHDARLAAAEALVPKPAVLGAGGPLAVRSVRREPGTPRARVVVDVAAPPGVTPPSLDLFAEGPTPDWALPVPAPVPGAPAGLQRFTFEIDGVPPGAKQEGVALKLTAVAGTSAIEVTAPLD